MAKDRVIDSLTVGLGILYFVAGIAETVVRIVTDELDAIPFWFGTLCGGGGAILLGILVYRDSPRMYPMLVIIGCFSGMLATMWTLLVPVIAVIVVVLTIQRVNAEKTAAA